MYYLRDLSTCQRIDMVGDMWIYDSKERYALFELSEDGNGRFIPWNEAPKDVPTISIYPKKAN